MRARLSASDMSAFGESVGDTSGVTDAGEVTPLALLVLASSLAAVVCPSVTLLSTLRRQLHAAVKSQQPTSMATTPTITITPAGDDAIRIASSRE